MATSPAEHVVFLNDGDPLPPPNPDGSWPRIMYRAWLQPDPIPEVTRGSGMVFELRTGLPTVDQARKIGEDGLARVVEELRH